MGEENQDNQENRENRENRGGDCQDRLKILYIEIMILYTMVHSNTRRDHSLSTKQEPGYRPRIHDGDTARPCRFSASETPRWGSQGFIRPTWSSL